jgi:hypothetical protein
VTSVSGGVNLSAQRDVSLGGRLSSSANGTLINTAYVSHPTDPNPSDNNATDSDIVLYIKLYIPLVIDQ